jgi:hypothetical protein
MQLPRELTKEEEREMTNTSMISPKYLVDEDEDATGRAALLEEVHERAAREDVTFTALILDRADYLLSVADPVYVVQALVTPSPISILWRALKRTPLHHRRARTTILTELMRRLMPQAAPPEIDDELKALLQKLISLSQCYE